MAKIGFMAWNDGYLDFNAWPYITMQLAAATRAGITTTPGL